MALKMRDNSVIIPTGNKEQDRESLGNIIAQWNANRLDLFELSEPNELLEFHGVMRFYFQDAGQKVATKCIRVSSTATSKVIIETLIEKFRPDMRMLSIPEYSLYEVHVNGEERKLNDEEKPLLVQLNWHKDDREGRFLLKREDDSSQICDYDNDQYMENFKRKLSKREKKELKKKEKKERAIRNTDLEKKEDGVNIAEKLYSELPETSFTRSISNPEAVMRRRRQQKLEKKLQQFRNEDGGPDSGGTLKVFGESLKPDVPYKTLLLSLTDTVPFVIKETLEKYGLETENYNNYILVQVIQPYDSNDESNEYHGAREYILDEEDCPLAIITNNPSNHEIITFHIKPKPSDYQPRKRKKKTKSMGDSSSKSLNFQELKERLPCLVEVNPDGSDIPLQRAKQHRLQLNVTEVGSERSMSLSGQYLQLFGPHLMPRHCVIAHTEGIVTVTPCSRDAETYVNNQRIYETTILQHGVLVRFGKVHTFRFIEGLPESRNGNVKRQLSDMGAQPRPDVFSTRPLSKEDGRSLHGNYETTFDVDGHIETVATKPQILKPQQDDPPLRRRDDHPPEYSSQNPLPFEKKYPILPATLELKEEGEDAFLTVIINSVQASVIHFKLAPTYTIYLAARYRSSTQYRPDCTPADRAHRLTALLNKVANRIQQTIQAHYSNSGELSFWMANASELLHFLKHDRHMSPYCIDAQDIHAESVQLAFRYLVQCIQNELAGVMSCFLSENNVNEDEGVSDVLHVLFSTMSLLRRCRVNAALTIQLFSQLFHFINMWLFNRLVAPSAKHNYCSKIWGKRLKHRLRKIQAWAEKQGLELAAECHLSRIIQAAHLLECIKAIPEEINYISDACFKLNSIQLRVLLENYQSNSEENRVTQEMVENLVQMAENTADELARSDGRDIKLEEDSDLQLPFLLPEDGYSCDIVRGFPTGLQEFLEPLCQQGLCRLTIQPMSNGLWTVYMSSDQDSIRTPSERNSTHGGPPLDTSRQSNTPEIISVTFKKGSNGMGLSIVAAKGVGCDKLGIYIKSVVKGGAADLDGRLQAGDQLLKVDGQSLVGITQEKAAEFMTRTGPIVTLEVAKQGAIYHGLATLLNQPSPVMQRALSFANKPLSRTEAHRLSERDLSSKMTDDQTDVCGDADTVLLPSRIQSSKSVPSLNSRSHSQERLRTPSTGNLKTLSSYSSYRSSASSTSALKSPDLQNMNARSHSTTNLKQDPMFRQMEIQHGNETEEQNYHLSEVMHSSDAGYYPMKPVPSAHYPLRSLSENANRRGNDNLQSFQSPEQRTHSLSDKNSNLFSNVAYPNNAARVVQDPGYSSSRQADIIRHIDFGQRNKENYLNSPPPVLPKNSLIKNRPVSQPNMSEEGHYQNIKIYQQQPVSHQNIVSNYQTTKPIPQQANYQNMLNSNNPHTLPPNKIERPMSTILSQKEQHEYEKKPKNISETNSDIACMGPSDRAFLRQEAKMEEMREEVRRRDERARELQQNHSSWHQKHPVGYQPYMAQGQLIHNINSPYQKITDFQQPPWSSLHSLGDPNSFDHRPPIAAKPKGLIFQTPTGNHLHEERPIHWQEQKPKTETNDLPPPPNIPPERPPPPEEMYGTRESPPLPPPPLSLPDASLLPNRTSSVEERANPRYGPSGYPPPPASHERPPSFNHYESLSDKTSYGSLHFGYHSATPPGYERMQRISFDSKMQQLYPDSKLSYENSNRPETDISRHSILQQKNLISIGNPPGPPLSPSPWEREEREKLRQRMVDEARRLRDQEISSLQTRSYLTSQEEDRLRALRLEQEFQRRAEEAIAQDDDEDESGSDITLEHAGAQNPMYTETEKHQTKLHHVQKMSPSKEDNNRHDRPLQQYEPDHERERQRIIQRIQEKEQHELARKQAELREQQQREIEEQKRLQEQEERQRQLRIEEERLKREQERQIIREMHIERKVDNSIQSNYQISRESNLSPYLMSSAPEIPSNHIVPPSKAVSSHAGKHVSFHEVNIETHVNLNNENLEEKWNSDNRNFYNATVMSPFYQGDPPTTITNSMSVGDNEYNENTLVSPQNSLGMSKLTVAPTPGVIGAQEVYRDPRARIEATRQHSKKPQGPEKLTFHEKMKMFAEEVGEKETPKEKVKTSRAQREIETNINGK